MQILTLNLPARKLYQEFFEDGHQTTRQADGTWTCTCPNPDCPHIRASRWQYERDLDDLLR